MEMEKEKEREGGSGDGEEWKVVIKFGGETIGVTATANSTVSQLKSQLQTTTNVLPRGQKLIHKGKVLEDSKTLRSSQISNGSKIMLMASQGLHQGDGPTINDAAVVPNYRKIVNAERKPTSGKAVEQVVPPSKSRADRWKLTGVVALSQSHLKAIPDEVWGCGSSARVLDLGSNCISQIPINIGCLTSIQKLILNANEITDDSLSWDGLTQLKNLTYLSLNQNLLTYLPPSFGALTSLEQLHIAGNKLKSLPVELGHLTRLEILKVNNNRLSTIPSSIGGCCLLTEVDVSSNLLVELPETMGSLLNLKSLLLSNNGLESLPSSIFKRCVKLSGLDLHGTQITMDILRQVEGWEEFDKRRRLKYQKQLDFRAGGCAQFDEGADKN